MKIVFFGTSEFALPSLRKLLGSPHKILALVTQPDRKKGRELKLSPPPAKVAILSTLIPVFQPANASSAESVEYLKNLGADLFVVISFGQILKQEVLAIPKFYSINLHGSVLPKYRGAAPTNWAIINGEKSSGITIIKMNEKMDEGDIILTRRSEIRPDDTNVVLSKRLSKLGSDALLEAVDLIEKGKPIKFIKQDGSQASYAPKLKKRDGLIDWNAPAAQIHNKVRGLLPWPGAYTHYDAKILKILRTEMALSPANASGATAGQVIDIAKGKGIIAATGSGDIVITHLQLEGKRAMDADSFVRGHRVPIGHKFV